MKKSIICVLLAMQMILSTACSDGGLPFDEDLDVSLMAFVGVTVDKPVKFVIYNDQDIEVVGDRESFVLALEAIYLTKRYRLEDDILDQLHPYGVMDVGNGDDKVKRLVLISKTQVLIGQEAYDIRGGERLWELVKISEQ